MSKTYESDAEEAFYKLSDPGSKGSTENSALDSAVLQEKIRRKANKRLMSLDALRGLNMLCIIGLAWLITLICNLSVSDFQVFGDKAVEIARSFRQNWSGPTPATIAKHMEHVEWNGLLHHDTIFPLFLFLAGVSFPFSYAKQRANGRPMWRVCLKIVIRGFALFVAGWIYQNKLRFNFSELRFMGVLQHIGLAWMFAAFIFLATSKRVKAQIGIIAGILILYWLLVALVPSRDVAPDSAFTPQAFSSRAAQLFTIRAPEIFPEDETTSAPNDVALQEQRAFIPTTKALGQEEPVPQENAETAPVVEETVAQENAEVAPVAEENVAQENAETAPVAEETVAQENAEVAPVVEEPVAQENAETAPVAEETVAQENAETAPVAEENVAQENAEIAPVAEENVAQENAETAPVAEENVAPTPAPQRKHTLKGLIAGLFNNAPLPAFDDPNYPEIGTVDHNLLPEGCVVNYIDRQFTPGRLYHDKENARAKMKSGELDSAYNPSLWRTLRDPEGLTCTFPAIATALLGMLFGGVLRRDDSETSKLTKVALLLWYGLILVVVGFLWHLVFPINKNLWNSSFVCFVGGYSAIALGLFYFFIDVCKLRWIGFPFAIVGMNSIGIFLIRRIVDFTNVRNFFFEDAITRFVPKEYPDPTQVVPEGVDPATVETAMITVTSFQSIATCCAGLLVAWLFLLWLYKKRIFFKL